MSIIKNQLRRVILLLVSFVMVCVLSTNVSASEYTDHTVTSVYSATLTYGTNGNVLGYATPNAADLVQKKLTDDTIVLKANIAEGWEFVRWETYYKGSIREGYNPGFILSSKMFFSVEGNPKSGYKYSSDTIQINKEHSAGGTFYVYAICKPIVHISSDISRGIEFQYNGGSYIKGSLFRYVLDYNSNLSMSVKVTDPSRVLDHFSVSNKSYYKPENYLTNSDPQVKFIGIKGPLWVNIHTRLKKQNIEFNSNSGEGTMPLQMFEYGKEENLNTSTFSKEGYLFNGWNTSSDGTGTSYSDGQKVTFNPENDGETLILYVQWTKCTNHSGGNATCTTLATCDKCGSLYGDFDKTKHTGVSEWTVQSQEQHEKVYNCCHDIDVSLEDHHFEKGICIECGYGCQHTGGNATCISKAICENCEHYYGNINADVHAGNVVWTTKNNVQHESEYDCCGNKVVVLENHEWENGICTECGYECLHTGGVANCTDKAICDICKYEYGEVDHTKHTGQLEWTVQGVTEHESRYNCCGDVVVSLETHEWKNGICAECGYLCEHTGGIATCISQAKCLNCNELYGNLDSINHEEELSWLIQDEAKHERGYDCCDTVVILLENHEWENGICTECGYECQHTGGVANCTDKAICDICKNAYGELNNNNHTNRESILSYDKDTHWYDCTCNVKHEENSHIFGDWVVLKEPTSINKGFKEKNCKCGFKVTEEIDVLSINKPQTGDDTNIGIYLALALFTLVAGIFIIRKNRD